MFKPSTVIPLAFVILAIVAIVLWPFFVNGRIAAVTASALPTEAPVTADYRDRAKSIAFWEKAVGEHHPGDMMSPEHLAGEYLQRYREAGDIQDVFRAQKMAQTALAVQPKNNIAALSELASVDLTLHRFREALAYTQAIERFDPRDEQVMIREASLDLELGRYQAARNVYAHLPPRSPFDIARDTVEARYYEIAGQLAKARALLERPTALENSQFEGSAVERAWFYFRSGEMAFEAGDNDAAVAFEAHALSVFPHDVDASRAKARFECALHRWSDCLQDASFSATIIPYPETLGYEADAQAALGRASAASQTRDLIRAVERVGNAQHISDRLLAIYYSDHGLYPDDAYEIAKRELAVRDDIFTEDTLAWAAARDGRWLEARDHMKRAIRFDTENSVMQYHAAIIALRFGDRVEAKRRFERALALNSQFHETFADDARAQLAKL